MTYEQHTRFFRCVLFFSLFQLWRFFDWSYHHYAFRNSYYCVTITIIIKNFDNTGILQDGDFTMTILLYKYIFNGYGYGMICYFRRYDNRYRNSYLLQI